MKIYFMYYRIFLRKSCRLWCNVEKHGRAKEATLKNIKLLRKKMCFSYRITKARIQTDRQTLSKYLLFIASVILNSF